MYCHGLLSYASLNSSSASAKGLRQSFSLPPSTKAIATRVVDEVRCTLFDSVDGATHQVVRALR